MSIKPVFASETTLLDSGLNSLGRHPLQAARNKTIAQIVISTDALMSNAQAVAQRPDLQHSICARVRLPGKRPTRRLLGTCAGLAIFL